MPITTLLQYGTAGLSKHSTINVNEYIQKQNKIMQSKINIVNPQERIKKYFYEFKLHRDQIGIESMGLVCKILKNHGNHRLEF